MTTIIRKLLRRNNFNHFNHINRQCLSTWKLPQKRIITENTLLARKINTYEGDGKTSVNILNKEMELGLMINSYSQFGFRLNNELVIVGPMALFSRTVMSWNVSNYEEINEESLSLFCMLEPKIDVLVIGIGDQSVTIDFSRKIIKFMQKFAINVEVLNTEQACATFNFLNAEGRMIAAAMIPPNHIKINEDDLMRRQSRQDLYTLKDEY